MYPRLFENPNALYLKKYGEDLDWTDLAPNFPFSYYHGKLICGTEGQTHNDTAPSDVRLGQGKTRGQYSGRIFVSEKVITFWHFPENKEKLLKVLKDIEDFIKDHPDRYKDIPFIKEIDFSDPRWVVEIPNYYFEDLKNYDDAMNVKDWKMNWHPNEDDQDFIPIDQYNKEYKRSEEELKIKHKEQPIIGKKPVPPGYGSKNPKYQSKRQWQMATLGDESKQENNYYPRLTEDIKHLKGISKEETIEYYKTLNDQQQAFMIIDLIEKLKKEKILNTEDAISEAIFRLHFTSKEARYLAIEQYKRNK